MMVRSSKWILASCLMVFGLGCAERAPHMMASKGDQALAQEDFVTAEQEYALVVQQQPWNWEARLQYGKALLGLGRARDAREQLEQAYSMRPKHPEVISTLAEAIGESGDVEGAVRLLRSISDERRTPQSWMVLGRFAERARDLDTAERAYNAAAKGDAGQSVGPQLALYKFYKAVGRDEDAVQRLAMAYWLQPQNRTIEDLVRQEGMVPGPEFARRPAEQVTARIPNPMIPRSSR